MAVPKYPFIVEVTRAAGVTDDRRLRENKSFETIGTAVATAEAYKRRPTTKRVVITTILDEWTPSQERAFTTQRRDS